MTVTLGVGSEQRQEQEEHSHPQGGVWAEHKHSSRSAQVSYEADGAEDYE